MVHEARPAAVVTRQPMLGNYRAYADHAALWDRLCRDHGVRRYEYGRSVEGRPLVCLGLGPARVSRLSIVVAGIHPMEWVGVEVLARWIERFSRSPTPDRRVLVFPIVNVDGFHQVEQDLRAGRRRLRRGNSRGVDLNRNFPTFHERWSLGRMVAPWLFRPGAGPLSEPETAALVRRVDDALTRGGTDLRAVTLHSFGGKVLFPYGGVWRRPQDFRELRGAAESVARAAGYQAVQSSRWVPGFFAPGMEIDHLYDAYGARALLVECSRRNVSWRRPNGWISPFSWFNPEDPREVVDRLALAIDPFLRGALPSPSCSLADSAESRRPGSAP